MAASPDEKVFNPILQSSNASDELKQAVRCTIRRLNERPAWGMKNDWVVTIESEWNTGLAKKMKDEGFTQAEDVSAEFRERFKE